MDEVLTLALRGPVPALREDRVVLSTQAEVIA
jgi:hypothetical protein